MASGWWPEEKRIEVVTAFVAGITNATELEKLTKVPAGTIRQWKTQEWWPELQNRVRLEKDDEFDSKTTHIIDKTLEAVHDRVINGEFFVNRDGSLTRKPMSGRDAAIITAIMVDKRQLLRGKPTSRVERVTDSDMLKKLADQMRSYAKGRTIEGEATEVLEALPNGETQENGQLQAQEVIPETTEDVRS